MQPLSYMHLLRRGCEKGKTVTLWRMRDDLRLQGTAITTMCPEAGGSIRVAYAASNPHWTLGSDTLQLVCNAYSTNTL